MRTAVRVRAHLLEALDSIILYGIRHADTNARVVLMVTRSHDLDRSVVEEEALFGIDGEGAEADPRRFLIHGLTVLEYLNGKRVKLGIVHVPALGTGNVQLLHDRLLHIRADSHVLCDMLRNQRFSVIDRRLDGSGIAHIRAVFQRGLDLDRPAVLRSLFQNGLTENTVVRNMQLILGVELDVAINTRALIPPAFRFQALDVNGKDVRSAVEIRSVGDIEEGFRVRAEGSLHQRSVEIKFRVDGSALKADEQLLVRKRFVKQEGFSVPSVATVAVSVRKQIVFIKAALRVIVVRQIHTAPVRIIPYLSRRTDDSARFTAAVRIGMAVRRLHVDVPSVETPFIIQIHYDSLHKRLTPL